MIGAGEFGADAAEAAEPADDGRRVGAVDAAGDGDAPAAGRQRQAGAARALSRQHAQRPAAVRGPRARVPATVQHRTAATQRPTARQTGPSRSHASLDGAFWPRTGTAAFPYAWNSLPGDLVNINLTVITFKRHLGPSSPHPTRCPFILHVHDWWFEA